MNNLRQAKSAYQHMLDAAAIMLCQWVCPAIWTVKERSILYEDWAPLNHRQLLHFCKQFISRHPTWRGRSRAYRSSATEWSENGEIWSWLDGKPVMKADLAGGKNNANMERINSDLSKHILWGCSSIKFTYLCRFSQRHKVTRPGASCLYDNGITKNLQYLSNFALHNASQ